MSLAVQNKQSKEVRTISYPVGRQTSSAMSLMDAMSSTPYPLAFM